MLLEIAVWKVATQFQEMRADVIDPWEIKAKLLTRSRIDLPHFVGARFAGAIDACLSFEEITKDLTEFEANQAYKIRVLGMLEVKKRIS